MSKQDFTAGTKSLVYVTPLVSLLLFAGNFLWLAKLQITVNDLSRENVEILRTFGSPSDVSMPESEPDRIKRQSDLGFGDLFSQIAVKQVWQGRATEFNLYWGIVAPSSKSHMHGKPGTLRRRYAGTAVRVLLQPLLAGPKGNTGPKGEKGDQGIRGTNSSVYSTVLLIEEPLLRRCEWRKGI